MNLKQAKELLERVEWDAPVKIGPETIPEPRRTCESFIKFLEGNSGNMRYLPYFNRLTQILKHDQKRII